jgi:hypothetical protein
VGVFILSGLYMGVKYYFDSQWACFVCNRVQPLQENMEIIDAIDIPTAIYGGLMDALLLYVRYGQLSSLLRISMLKFPILEGIK